MNWPKALIREIAARRCIIFLGAGASAGSIGSDGLKHPPTWKFLLEQLIDLIPDKASYKPILDGLITKEKFLDAAEIIYELAPKADYSALLRSEIELPRYGPSKIHEIVMALDPKVVITTNYDKIYENYCTTGIAVDGYNVSKYYEDHLIANLRSPIRIIIKAHGCISDPNRIVLTKSQYFKARQTNSNFYKILDALFVTSTILFIGYSLNDPDIQLVLENVNITAPSDHPHYFVIGNDMDPIIKKSSKISYNLDFIEFPAGNFDELNKGLGELLAAVEEFRSANQAS